MDRVEQLLKDLTEANGVPGYEGEVRQLLVNRLQELSDRIEHDKMGSVVGVKKGKADAPKVMVVGHMDEIGFMVKEITKEGFIKFLPLGGWWGHVALGQRMRIITAKGPVIGVVGSKPPHVLPPEERKKVLDIKDMFIDVGTHEKYDVKKKLGIRLGDPIVPDAPFTIMGNSKMYMSKAFDNRMACAVVLEVLRKFRNVAHPNTIYGCASVQEEVGSRGAQTLAHLIDPDVCIVCDTGIGLDVPPEPSDRPEKLGSGPAILLFDARMIPNLRLRDLTISTAEKTKTPFHLTYMDRGATDGAPIHTSRLGVPSIVIGPAVRYIHSHNSILNRSDFDNTVKLICEVIKKLDRKTVDSLTEG